MVGDGALTAGAVVFDVPELGMHAATELVRRAVPALTERLVRRVVEVCEGRPGELRRFVRRVAERAVASEQDLEELIHGLDDMPSTLPQEPLARAVALLDRGRYNEARRALDTVTEGDALARAVAWARLELGLGDAPAALERLRAAEELARQVVGSPLSLAWTVYFARAKVGLGEYGAALPLLEAVSVSRDSSRRRSSRLPRPRARRTSENTSSRGRRSTTP